MKIIIEEDKALYRLGTKVVTVDWFRYYRIWKYSKIEYGHIQV